MILFWVVAGVLSAAAAGLILVSAARAASRAGSADPTLALYRRQLSEIDDLADRGLIAEGERKGAHAEAARRLLTAADHALGPWTADAGLRRPILAVAALAPLVALALYMAVGVPGFGDQPFKARVAAWRHSDLATLTAPQMAAVLGSVTQERPRDPEAFRYLALAQQASDNPSGAARALRRAIELAPQRADLWESLGQALVNESGGPVTPQARMAFTQALKRDPKAVTARFHLARAQVEGGDKAAGLAQWRALAADLPAQDPRREAVLTAITEAEAGPKPVAAPLPGAQMAAVRGMVQGLAARLEASPEDPEGWVRLVKSYAVLGDAAQRDAALAKAKARYARDPKTLAELDAAARTEAMK
jgi:cytochrome c-type biogenesis protein CcmH